VAQLGATFGRQFSYDLLHAVLQIDEASLQRDLGRLIEAELFYQTGLTPRVTYMFKHALIQDAAYQSLVRHTRQHYHQRIAQVLVARFPDTVATQPELLAYHYDAAGLHEEAIPYWQQAGQRAIERSANVEAVSHLTKGLEILETLPVTYQHTQQKLMLQLALGTSLLTIKGPTAHEVQHAYTRAQELCEQVGDSPQLFSVLMGLWRFNLTQSRHQAARELGERCFTLAQRMRAPALLHEAHMMLGSTMIFLGELTAAHANLSKSIDLYDPEQFRSLVVSRGIDSGVVNLSRIAFVLWKLGYPDQALAKSLEALTRARESSHAYSLSFALHYAIYLHQFRREAQRVREMADTAIALAREQGFVLWLSGSTILKGWALAELGAVEEGTGQIHEGLSTWQAIGAELGRPHHLALLAEAYGRGEQAEEGLRVLADALADVHRTLECHYEAELYRLKGELILRAGQKQQTEEAETCFRYALDVSRRQRARSLELRAALSLGRLWQQQGKRLESRQMLAGVYGWFTEGFDTRDLQEANALLTELT
jgi:predicted ATPase